MDKVRIDKWLWAVRIFKTRTLATKEVRGGGVRINEDSVKSSTHVTLGDRVQVRKNGILNQFVVQKLIDKRVSAVLAEQCYEDVTPEEEKRKYDAQFIGKGKVEIRDKGDGRPTKKQRREIDEFKDYKDDWEAL